MHFLVFLPAVYQQPLIRFWFSKLEFASVWFWTSYFPCKLGWNNRSIKITGLSSTNKLKNRYTLLTKIRCFGEANMLTYARCQSLCWHLRNFNISLIQYIVLYHVRGVLGAQPFNILVQQLTLLLFQCIPRGGYVELCTKAGWTCHKEDKGTTLHG